MDMISGFLKKLIPENAAGLIGIVQSLIGPIREVVISVIRLLAILLPKAVSEDWIVRARKIFDAIEGGIEWAKNKFLGE